MTRIRLPSVKNIALLTAAVIIALLLAELMLKLAAPQNCYVYPFPKGMFQQENETCYRLTPDFTGKIATSEFSTHVSTNSNGFIGSKGYGYEKSPGTIRILGLGDSFQFGVGVEQNETYLDILEESLNRNAGGKRHEILNYGVPGYATRQELKYFEKEGKKYRPDIVLVSFFVNDLAENLLTANGCIKFVRDGYLVDDYTAEQKTALFKARLFMNQNSQLYCRAKNAALQLSPQLRTANNRNISNDLLAGYSGKSGLREDARQQLAATFGQIRQLRKAVEDENASMILVFIPDRLQVDTEEWNRFLERYSLQASDYDPSLLNKFLNSFADEENITAIDLLPEFRKDGERKKLYNYIDAHWNREGNALAAKIIEKELTKELAKLTQS